jgi:hypothetical protein
MIQGQGQGNVGPVDAGIRGNYNPAKSRSCC